MNEQIVYVAAYNPMVEESEYGIISIHASYQGAANAVENHKDGKRKEWRLLYPTKDEEPYSFGQYEDWDIWEMQLQP